MDHKLTLWPSIAAVIMWFTPLRCQEKVDPPKPLLEFRLIEPGIPGIPNVPPVLPLPKMELESGPIVLG